MYPFLPNIRAVTFDDFNTLRYNVDKRNIVYPIFRNLKKYGVKVELKDFLSRYVNADKAYRKNVKETLRESLLDNIIIDVLKSQGYKSLKLRSIVTRSIDEVLATQRAIWYPDALLVLKTLRKKGYILGLITNTHWRISNKTKKEFEKYFGVITLSYEHGYAKPHPTIFLTTLKKLNVSAECCLHIGDDPTADIQGAKEVGMRTAFIKRGKEKANADIQIKQLKDLTRIL